MKFRQHDDTIIELRLTDRRGRPIRAAVCDNLKIRVWTQDPLNYIAFYPRDIRHEKDKDILVMPDYMLSPLQPGVIVYRYSFHEPIHGHGFHDHRTDEFERSETVVTGIYWRGFHRDPLPSNPINSHTLEHLREVIEDVQRDLTRQLRDVKRFVAEEYTNNLDDESRRAQEAERDLSDKLTSALSMIEEETRRSSEADTVFLSELQKLSKAIEELRGGVEDSGKENSDALENLGKSFNEAVESVKKEIEKQLESQGDEFQKAVKRLNERIDQELESRNIRENLLQNGIDTESARAKTEEERLDGRIDNLKSLVKGNTSAVESERSRAQLVEKDLAESLQRLKQSVQQGNISYDEAIEEAKKELKELVDYRVKEIIGEAPEALDTLEEIAAQLRQDEEAMQILKGILVLKANEEDVYKKQKIDSLLEEINNTIASERNRVNDRLSDISRVIEEERQRALLAEKANADAIALINGNKETVGSIAHAIEDAKHYADDQDEALKDSLKTVGIDKVRSWFPQKN